MDAKKQHGLKSLARQLKGKGYKIGIITSASIDHATPGGFYASQPDRSMYYEIGVDAANSGFDFFGGAGLLQPRSKRTDIQVCIRITQSQTSGFVVGSYKNQGLIGMFLVEFISQTDTLVKVDSFRNNRSRYAMSSLS